MGRHSFLAGVAALGGFLFGFDTAVISGALRSLIDFFALEDRPAMQGWLVSSVVLGSIVGAALSGRLADRLGRKKTLAWAGIGFAASALGTFFCQGFAEFIALRLLAGVAVGLAAMVSPLYIAEISPERIRGRMMALNQLALTIGILVAYLSNEAIASWLHSSTGNAFWGLGSIEIWRLMLGAVLLPAIVFLVLLAGVPESPAAGRIAPGISIFSGLFRVPQRRSTLMVLYLAIISQLSGIDLVLHYGPLILERAGFSFAESLGGQLTFGVVLVIFTVLAMWKVDTLGRRPLLLVGNTGICLALAFAGYFFTGSGSSEQGLLVALAAFVAFFALSMGPIPWIVMAELFPTPVRGQGMALATLSLFGANWVIAQLFPLGLAWFGESVSFWILATLTLPTFYFVWKILPETKGRALVH